MPVFVPVLAPISVVVGVLGLVRGPFRFGVVCAASGSCSNLGTHQMFDPSFFDVQE